MPIIMVFEKYRHEDWKMKVSLLYIGYVRPVWDIQDHAKNGKVLWVIKCVQTSVAKGDKIAWPWISEIFRKRRCTTSQSLSVY